MDTKENYQKIANAIGIVKGYEEGRELDPKLFSDEILDIGLRYEIKSYTFKDSADTLTLQRPIIITSVTFNSTEPGHPSQNRDFFIRTDKNRVVYESHVLAGSNVFEFKIPTVVVDSLGQIKQNFTLVLRNSGQQIRLFSGEEDVVEGILKTTQENMANAYPVVMSYIELR